MRIYTATMDPVAVSVAKSLITIAASPGHGLILRASISQVGLTASEMLRGNIFDGGGGPVGTAITPKPLELGNGAFAGSALSNLTTEPSQFGSPYAEEAFNVLTGWTWIPMPEERPVVNTGDQIVLRLDVAPSAPATFSAQLTFGLFG